ncbi:MAG: hypothetical protein ACJA2M_000326 [Polaribacter sp.]|jgi:hypothetical protein
MKKITHCIVYKLHKNNSPTVIDCSSEKRQDEQLFKIIKEGYKNAYKATPDQATKVLNDYGKRFEPKPLTQQERWINWTLGRS